MIQQRTTQMRVQDSTVGPPPFQPPHQQVVRSSSTMFSDFQQSYHNGAEQAFRVDTFEHRLLREDEFRESLLRVTVGDTDVTEYREVRVIILKIRYHH